MRLGRHGFTLIELLVVLVIVAGLISIVTPRYLRSLEQSEEVMLVSNLTNMRDVLDQFYADRGIRPSELLELVDAGYIRNVPQDPMTKSSMSWIIVNSEDAGVPGIADIRSGADGETRSGIPFSEL